MKKVVSWSAYEDIGLGIPNPRPYIKVEGSPEFLEAFIAFCEAEEQAQESTSLDPRDLVE